MMRKRASFTRGCLNAIMMANILMVLMVTAIFAVTIKPSLGAEGSDLLRSIVGDQVVADMEMALFQIQDTYLQWRYSTGLVTPVAPWQVALAPTQPGPRPTATLADANTDPLPTETALPPVSATPITVPTTAPVQTVWQPPPVLPLGSLDGEGVWSTYIQDFTGRTVAYRTFVQPDPNRPYAVVGIVAFNRVRTRLHFVLGSVEPFVEGAPKRTGAMPAIDKTPGVLLAMFNGGFKARNGQYGAMADGITALPARDGLGTIAIYQDGSLRLGEWGTEIEPSPDMIAWRQNGPLVIHQGAINPRIYNNLPDDWGVTVKGVSPTWRSGLGMSADGQTYYYLCGSSLSMQMLAKSMQAAGIYDGLQLDINTYLVNFVAVRTDGRQLAVDALFPDMMKENIDRYLYPSGRDFFYVTISGNP